MLSGALTLSLQKRNRKVLPTTASADVFSSGIFRTYWGSADVLHSNHRRPLDSFLFVLVNFSHRREEVCSRDIMATKHWHTSAACARRHSIRTTGQTPERLAAHPQCPARDFGDCSLRRGTRIGGLSAATLGKKLGYTDVAERGTRA